MRTGQPQAAGASAWPAFGSQRVFMAFQDVPRVSVGLFPGMYELHDQVVCRRRVAGGIAWNWNHGIVSPPLPPRSPDCG